MKIPYPNYHSARIKDPGAFARIVVLKTLTNGIMILGGPLKTDPGGSSKNQAYRFPKSKFTAQQAKSWLSENNISYIRFEPAEKAASISEPDSNYGLSFEGDNALAVSSEFTEDDVPVQRFKKDMISVGEYTHPIHKWNLDVTKERLYQWLAAFKKMRENGVDVEIVKDHSESADDIVGYVIDMMVEPNSKGELAIFGIHEMRGEAAIHLAGICKNVSVFIDRDYIDGERRSYGEAIVHSALCQRPVVPGQDAFIPVAASAASGSKKIPIMTMKFSQEITEMNPELLKKIQELLGADETLTEETLLDRLTSKLSSLNTKIEDVTKENTALSGKIEQLEASTNKEETAPKIDPNLAEQMGTTATEQLSLLVKAGKITPACEKLLTTALIGEIGNRNVRMLSIGKDKPSVFTGIIAALKENDIVKLGEQTGAQVTLSRVTPGGDEKKDDFDQDTQDKMRAQMGVETKE